MKQTPLQKHLIGSFSFKRLIRSMIQIYLCIQILGWFLSDSMIFQPQPCTYQDTDKILKLETEGGDIISAFYLSGPEDGYTVLYNHANAVDLGDIQGFLARYNQEGVALFAYDFPGYGTSPGRPTTGNACAAADAALNYLIKEKGIPLDRILVHGRSAGGGPALYLAEKYDVAGLIVESTFVSAFRVMTRVPLMPFDKFKNINRIDHVNCPVLIIHGKEDQTIPFWHGEKLFEKAKQPKTACWLNGASHNRIPPEAEKEYWKAIRSFRDLLHNELARQRLHACEATTNGRGNHLVTAGTKRRQPTQRVGETQGNGKSDASKSATRIRVKMLKPFLHPVGALPEINKSLFLNTLHWFQHFYCRIWVQRSNSEGKYRGSN